MGQSNSTKIEIALAKLENQKTISQQQVESFLEDYLANSKNTEQVKNFEDNCQVKLFLKNFINNMYPNHQNFNKAQSFQKNHLNQTKIEKMQILSLINSKIASVSTKIQSNLKIVQQRINEVENYHSINEKQAKNKQIIKEIFKIQQLQFYTIHEEGCIEHYIDFGKNQFYITPQNTEYAELRKLIKKNDQFVIYEVQNHQKNKDISILGIFDKEAINYLVKIKLQRKVYEVISRDFNGIYSPILKQLITTLIQHVILSFGPLNYHKQRKKIIKNCLDLAIITIKFELVSFKLFICTLINFQQDSSKEIQQLILQYNFFNSQSVILALQQFQKRVTFYDQRYRFFKRNLLEDSKILIQFDKLRQLRYMYGIYQDPLLFKNLQQILNKGIASLDKLFSLDFDEVNNQNEKQKQKHFKINPKTQLIKLYDIDNNIQGYVIVISKQNELSKVVSTNAKTTTLNSSFEKQEIEDYHLKQKCNIKKLLAKKKEKENISVNNRLVNIIIDSKQQQILKKKSSIKTPSTISIQLKKKKTLSVLKQIEKDVNSIYFDVLAIQDSNLNSNVIKIMNQNSFFRDFVLQNHKTQFMYFLRQLHYQYQRSHNSYHNFRHGICVLQTAYLISKMGYFEQNLNDFEKFTLLFSALCHDVGHDGFNNDFHMTTNSDIGQIYHKSPLQNYHCFLTLKILKKNQNFFLKDIPKEKYLQFRKNVISSILYTDNILHLSLIKNFAALDKNIPAKKQNIQLIMGFILHSSDFGGVVKPYHISRKWSDKINIQFENQYNEQINRGFQGTSYMKDLDNRIIRANNQVSFLSNLVLPLYKILDGCCRQQASQHILEIISNNIQIWQLLVKGKEIVPQAIYIRKSHS